MIIIKIHQNIDVISIGNIYRTYQLYFIVYFGKIAFQNIYKIKIYQL